MQPKIVYTSKQKTDPPFSIQAPCIGQLAGVSEEGEILVQFGANPPLAARFVSRLPKEDLVDENQIGAEVLLVFEGNAPDKPVITDFVAPAAEKTLHMVDLDHDGDLLPMNVKMDGRHAIIEAQERITLQCGKGSITLNRDGKIVLRGTQIISRASGANKIKGASVSIN